jgi:hypothetical protein
MTSDAVCALIATPLEPELVARIEAVDPSVRVLCEPTLLPRPQYQADHTGLPPVLSAGQQQQRSRLRHQAEVSLGFGWQEPKQMPRHP